jgi:hypothetical protein
MSQDTNDNREGKPLFIAPEKSDFIELIGANGAVLGQFGYFGTFEGGMHRYYAGTHGIDMAGHEIAVRAQQACGSEWVWIKCRDVHYGPVHPVFRWGYYR